jgi:hypothetical protein
LLHHRCGLPKVWWVQPPCCCHPAPSPNQCPPRCGWFSDPDGLKKH